MSAEPKQPMKRIGQLLLERGLITQRQLDEALAQQKESQEFLGQILVKRGLITADQLVPVFADQFGMAYEHVHPEEVDWALVRQYPASLLSAGTCLPIRGDDFTITVAIANPLDAWSLSDIERAGVRKIRPVLVLERELRAVVTAYRQRLLEAGAKRLNGDANGG
jgi:type IV pilus assembly protein PilB